MTESNREQRMAKKDSRAEGRGAEHVARMHGSVKPDEMSVQDRVAHLTDTNRQLKRKIFDLYTIFEISRNFNAVLNYDSLLDSFILTSLAQVGASKAAIFLPDDASPGRFRLSRQRGSGKFPDIEQYFADDSRLATYLTRLNRPAPVEDLIKNVATEEERRILECFQPGLAAPLIYQTRFSGLFVVSDKISDRPFQMEDIEFLSILGNQISVAIENARLYTAEKTATERLRTTQKQLVHTERLAALGEMSAKIAHEVNNPLGIIKNYNLLVRRSLSKDSEAFGYAVIVAQEIDRIARIVRELLDFHRPRGLSFQKVQITNVVEDVLGLMGRRLHKEGIELVRRYSADPIEIEGSPENLKQVFINLILNAIDAMPDRGELRVGISSEEKDAVITFCDTGPGIDPEVIPRIFEPFFTTKDSGKGTGLGLSVCYGIIRKHSGTITYKNNENGGCFMVRLPLVREDEDNDKDS